MERSAYAVLMNFLLFAPLIGLPFILIDKKSRAKLWGSIFSGFVFFLSLWLFYGYLQYRTLGNLEGGFVFYSAYDWLDSFHFGRYDVKYITGVDGLSIFLILLTTLLFFLSIVFSTGSIKEHEKGYYALMLLLETGVLGVFMALDLVLFYFFFEVGLIPMYFLIGLWGGKQRVRAAVKFFLYTLVGSVLLLIGVLYVGWTVGEYLSSTGHFTSDYMKILSYTFSVDEQQLLFWAFTFAFLIKVPAFPFHTWLPLAHTEAPTAGSVILAGLLLKMGTYALVRFSLPLFPAAAVANANLMALLGVIGILYGGMVAMVQKDVKKLIAYSSVAHMGFVVMGIFAFTIEALNGAVLQMINHGLSTGALFLLVGMIYDRRHTRMIKDFQGIAQVMPVLTFFFMVATFASIGVPGLNGFVGEFLLLLGSFHSDTIHAIYPILGAAGVIVAAVYMLWMFRRVFFGTIIHEENRQLKDLNLREVLVLVPLALLMFIIGLHATPFLEEIGKSTQPLLEQILQTAMHQGTFSAM